ncbi:hypothetical protein NP493_1486g00017 [Ridgeia piscesae]|uniref:Fibronectin type-III domain-containing protein n=1 Tax=Ridgeia piscesae TaxID=27915 RepID=A0AAD9K1J5_RIDPI|nr:hypothetical protein NP493_1486g00017 [Ridgeia piscesae]
MYPLPPTSVTVTGRTTNTVSISWEHDSTKSYCEKWKVEYTEKDKTQMKTIPIDSVDVKSVTIPSLAPGRTYTIKVFAITSDGVVSKTAKELDVTTKPLAVTALEAVAKDDSKVDVSWSPNTASTQDNYQLRYRDDTKQTAWSEVVSLTDKKQTVTGLFPGDQYTFEVKAVSHSQTSAVKTKTAVLYPLPPTKVTAKTMTETDRVTVSWEYDTSQSYCEKWRVNYTVKGFAHKTHKYTSLANELEIVIDKLQAGQHYTISVYGVTIGGVVSKTSVDTDVTVS